MPFTENQKTQFIALLQAKGWQLRDDTIWSPSEGLYFNNSHFAHWGPVEMHDIFTQRAGRIAKSQLSNWQRVTHENEEVALTAKEVMKLNP
jgi:hypothetical protein